MSQSRTLRFVWKHEFTILASILAYLLAFFLLYRSNSSAAAAISVLPVMVVGWYFGLRAGLSAAVLAVLVTVFLLHAVAGQGWYESFRHGSPGFVAAILSGTVVGYLHDLSRKLKQELIERRRVEGELSASKDQYRMLYEETPSMYFTLDTKGTVLSVNQFGAAYLGYSPEELVGQTVLQVFLDLDRAAATQYVTECLAHPGQVFNWELRKVRKDGSRLWVKETARAIPQPGGDFVVLVVCEDITEHKQAVDALRHSEEGLRQLVNVAFEAIAIQGAGVILEVNPAFCRMFGYERDEAIGKTALDFAAPEYRDLVHQKITSGDSDPYEVMALRKDGTTFPVELVGKPISYMGHAARVTALYDLTARSLAETQRLDLALANQKISLLKEFLNTVSHDLKTPLSVIITSLYLIERKPSPKQQKQKLETIKDQAQRLEKLIEDILTVNRLEMLPELTFQPVNVKALLAGLRDEFVTLAEKQHLTIQLNLGQEPPLVDANETELRRALVNLIENALRYTPLGGVITIRTTLDRDRLVIAVQDTGIGIDETDIPHIFEHFYRTDKARATETGGSGLGLAIVKKIVETHGGTIAVESVPKQGSTFRIFLPITQAKPGQLSS